MAGSYSYIAIYSGDSNYKGSTGVVEPLTIGQGTTSTATTILDSVTNLPPTGYLGEKVYDTATVTGTPFTPTGTVTYEFYTTIDGTGSHADQTVTLNANGTVPNSTISAALMAGSYSYIAIYSGDSNYKGSTGVVEPLTIGQGTTSTATTILDSVTNLPPTGYLGEKVYDTATVTGTPFTPTGTVTYEFFTTINGTGTHVDQTVTLNANGTVPNSTISAALMAGSYSYIAIYSGDSNYKGSTGVVEPLTIGQGTTSTATTILDSVTNLPPTGYLGEKVYDTATVTGTPFTPMGTVTYEFFTTINGTGTHVDQTVTLNANGTVPNSTISAALMAGSYSYIAIYSGDSNYKGSTGVVEPLTIISTPPCITVTKVADCANITVGQTAGFTVTIKNTGTVTATGVTLNDPLPAGLGNDVNWVIDTHTGNFSSFTITGAVGSQNLVLNPSPTTLAAGASLTVHITAATMADDISNTCTVQCTIPCNFNGTPIPGGDYIWFNCNVSAQGLCPTQSTTICCTGQSISFTCGNQSYNVPVPDCTLTFSPNCSTATTSFNSGSGSWNSNDPVSGLAGNEFLCGVPFKVPTGGLSGGIQNVKWTGNFGQNGSCTVNWQWGAAAYSNFSSDCTTLGIKPCDDNKASQYKNSDHCGTPECYSQNVCGGATGGGGSNCTGSYSGTCTVCPPCMACGTGTLPNTATVTANLISPVKASATITITAGTNTISGTKYLDATGNGFSSDDTGLPGVTINLYKDVSGNGVLGSNDGMPVASTVTGSNGTYSFSGLLPGTYFAQEVVPSSYLQTGGGPNGAVGATYYTVCVKNGQSYCGNDFDDFYMDDCAATNISYTVYNNSCQTTTVTDLRGHTAQGDLVSVTFTIPAGASPDQVSLVSYTAPGSSFDATTANKQQIFDLATGTFGPGTYTLTVCIPNCYYQVDFVCGAAINQLGGPPGYGPDGSDIFYSAQSRLFSADNGGTQVCGSGQTPIGKGDFALPSFWSSAKGQTLINTCDSTSSSTSPNSTCLSQWLVSTFPDLYGAGSGNHCLVGLKNSQVATCFTTKFSGADQQVLATALSVYCTSINLAGTGASNLAKTDGFTISACGSGGHAFCVGTNGAAFGVANNTTEPVLQLLACLNTQTAPGGALSSGACTVITGCNNSSGHLSLTASSADSGNADVALINSIQDLSSGTILVYVDDSQGNVTGDEQAAIDRAIASLNGDLSAFGVTLVDNSADPSGLIDSNIIITLADTSDIGGQADGVLGVTELGGSITLIDTWNYSFSQTPGQDQYDFQTVATHEMGHALGLGHSTDTNSVMYPYLSPGDSRHDLTTADLAVIEQAADTAPEPLMAASTAAHAPAALGANLVAGFGVPAINAALPNQWLARWTVNNVSQSQTASIGFNQNAAFVQGDLPAAVTFQIGSSLVSTTPVSVGQQQKLDQMFSVLNLETDGTTSESLDVSRGENTQRQDLVPSSNSSLETQTDPWAGLYYHSDSEQMAGSDVSALDTYFAALALEAEDFGEF